MTNPSLDSHPTGPCVAVTCPKPDDDAPSACLVCGEPGAPLQRVYDGCYQRVCDNAHACRRREAERAAWAAQNVRQAVA